MTRTEQLDYIREHVAENTNCIRGSFIHGLDAFLFTYPDFMEVIKGEKAITLEPDTSYTEAEASLFADTYTEDSIEPADMDPELLHWYQSRAGEADIITQLLGEYE